MLKAVIFDMDGVLVDTEPLYDRHRIAYLKRLGHELEPDFFDSRRVTFGGLSARSYWKIMIEHLKLPHSIEHLIKDSRKDYLEFLLSLPELKPNPGIKELIDRLLKAKIKLAIGSSASSKRINTFLKIFNFEDRFKVIVCGDDVKQGKPAPDIYLKAAELLSVDPRDCVVIEDAANGVKSAKAAGMKVIGYAGSSHNTQDLSGADLIIKSFSELDIEKLTSLTL